MASQRARSSQPRLPGSPSLWLEKRPLSEIAFTDGRDCLKRLLPRRPEIHFLRSTRHKMKSIHREMFTLAKGRCEDPSITFEHAKCHPHFLPALLFLFLFVFFCPSSLRALWSPWSSSAPAACSAAFDAFFYCICIICSRAALARSVSPFTLVAPLTAACGCSCCSGDCGCYSGCDAPSWAAAAFWCSLCTLAIISWNCCCLYRCSSMSRKPPLFGCRYNTLRLPCLGSLCCCSYRCLSSRSFFSFCDIFEGLLEPMALWPAFSAYRAFSCWIESSLKFLSCCPECNR